MTKNLNQIFYIFTDVFQLQIQMIRKSVDEGEQEVKSTRVISHDGYNIGTWGVHNMIMLIIKYPCTPLCFHPDMHPKSFF